MAWILILALVLMMLAKPTVSDAPETLIGRIARAIAHAEGYYAGDTLPFRRNNPGSIVDPTTRTLIQYPSAQDGWTALYNLVGKMLSGESRYYSPDMSIYEIAQTYTGGDKPDAWARIVSGDLGVTPDTLLGALA